MTNRKNLVQFINHASVILAGETKSILTDPWFEGDAFHRGWKLIFQNECEDIENILQQVNYIWISHEHPDHFSIPFFKKYKNIILQKKIDIIFQLTKDRRVAGFLRNEGFNVIELISGENFRIEENFNIKVIKDEFYDSALIAKIGESTIFNINDCPLHSIDRIKNFRRRHGTCDILLTQFSYAAWKGGKNNRSWRETAAREKLEILLNQGKIFGASVVIPFASYVWFANVKNYYLNDSVNTPQMVVDHCQRNNAPFGVQILAPYECHGIYDAPKDCSQAIKYWKGVYSKISEQNCISYQRSYSVSELEQQFRKYCTRIKKKNSWWLIKILSKVPKLQAFSKLVIYLDDIGEAIEIDIPSESFSSSTYPPDVSLHSESLGFIFSNPFGFDTLTVNGCFEAISPGGFGRLTKNFALENLNNLGLSLSPAILFNWQVLVIFIGRLIKVTQKLRSQMN